MAYLLVVPLLLTAALLLFGQWVWLERKHNRRHEELRGKFSRYKARADEMLASSKLQISSLQHQLTGARLEAMRSERQAFPKTVIQTGQTQAAVVDSGLMLYGDESRPMGYESSFAASGFVR